MSDRESVSEILGSNNDAPLSRRGVIVAGVTSIGALGAFAVARPARASATVSTEELTADGDEITSHDGSIDEIHVDPVIGVEWEGFNEDATIDVEISFQVDGESDLTPYEETETLPATNGSEAFDYSAVDLLAAGWDPTTFEADEDGGTKETTVTAICSWEIPEFDLAGSESGEFHVTVNNHESRAQVGGEVSTTATSDEEV